MKRNKIAYTSRTAIKIHDNYYTVEAMEERQIDDGDDADKEWQNLCDTVNDIVDTQCQEIVEAFK